MTAGNIADIISIVSIYVGILFIVISAIGIIRMPDVYTRMSAVTKAVTLGVGFILLGVIIHFNETGILIKCTIIFVFLLFSLSVAAHVVGLTAYRDKTPMTDLTFLDELARDEAGGPKKVDDPDDTVRQEGEEEGGGNK
jgi:multicomponent Na+:H+ antiporter subunit G